ncbi:MAG: type IV pilus biogenesis/stability protein PilW, partial [Candidatus Brocadiales bacterium]
KKLPSIFLTTFILLSSPSTIAAGDPELMSLYERALEGMERPLKKEDFQHTGLKTASDYDDLVQMCIAAGDYPKALEFTMEALELDAFDPIANLNAGIIHYKQEDYEQAAYYLEWALRIERKLHRTRGVRLGEEILSTSEPPAHLTIMALLEKAKEEAKEKASEEVPPEETETGGVPTASGEMAETLGRSGLQKSVITKTPPVEVPEREVKIKGPEKRMESKKEGPVATLFRRLGSVDMQKYVSDIYAAGGDGDKVIVVVNDKWKGLSYQIRLKRADKLWGEWQRIKRRTDDKVGMYRIQLIDHAGEKVGGSNWLNTKVWVKEP